jgi:hypothetical protein
MNGSAHALFCVNFHRESALKRGQNLNLSTHSRIALHYCKGHGKFYVPLINVVAVSSPVFLISRACHQAPKSALTINLLLSYYGPSPRRCLIVHPSLLVFFHYSTFIYFSSSSLFITFTTTRSLQDEIPGIGLRPCIG